MEDDFITALTYEVKEEILEQYFYERRLIELQIPPIYELVQQVKKLERNLMLRFSRLYELMMDDQYITQFNNIIGITYFPFKRGIKHRTSQYKISSIKLKGFTSKGKLKNLLLEQYRTLYQSAEKYRSAWKNLKEECKAVNHNIAKFAKRYDLMVIINFLNSMDPELVMKKYFLGSNFTPDEIGKVGEGLAFKKISFKHFQLAEPPEISHPAIIRKPLVSLAGDIYTTHTDRIKTLLRQK
jgi:hypothetical protein